MLIDLKMKNNKIKYVLSSLFIGCVGVLSAQNPIIQTAFTADPAPMVFNDRLYVYTSHDEDDSTWFTMNNWKLFSTNDMVNWTDHGVILSYNDFDWAKRDAWAAQCIERNGKFFMYVPMISKTNNKGAIGVAVADSPFGPFHDPLGKPLVQSEWGDIDPTVFIDDDSQAHLYWGNPKLKYVKLNEDMISYSGDIVEVPMTEESFGKREGNPERPTKYEEGPWLYKRKNVHYLFWPGGELPEFIGYSTSKSPQGPWKYGGIIMPAEGKSFTNHPGVIDFRGKTYFFYHNGALPGGSGFTRSVSVQELEFNKDGSISPFKMTSGITKAIATVNPYAFNQAEMISWSENVKSYQNKVAGVFIKAKKNGAYSSVKNVDFGKDGATTFSARVGTTHNGGVTMDVHLDSLDGPIAGTVKVPMTGGDDRFETVKINLSNSIKGVHNLYFVFNGKAEKDIMFFDYWTFSK